MTKILQRVDFLFYSLQPVAYVDCTHVMTILLQKTKLLFYSPQPAYVRQRIQKKIADPIEKHACLYHCYFLAPMNSIESNMRYHHNVL